MAFLNDIFRAAFTPTAEREGYFKVSEVGGFSPITTVINTLIDSLNSLKVSIANPPWLDKSANQIRAQVTGSATVSGTLTTVTTVTNLGSFPADHLQQLASRNTWAIMCRGLIT